MNTVPVRVPWVDLKAASAEIREDLDAAYGRVMDRGRFILGEEVAAFEREFADYVGVRHAVGVANGTEALQLALWAGEIRPGDRVLTVSHTATATVAAIELAGGRPVLAEIEATTFTLDVGHLKTWCESEAGRRIVPSIRAIIAVHLYGHPVDMPALSELAAQYGWWILEDCAQAHGARCQGKLVGTWGKLAAFSFYPTKNLGALGDGGAVVTQDSSLAKRLRTLRQYGWERRYISDEPGMNSRLDELQAAFLRARLGRLDADNAKRVAVAQSYLESLERLPVQLPSTRSGFLHVFHQFTILVKQRDHLSMHLLRCGVQTAQLYPLPVHLQPAYFGRLERTGDLAITEEVCENLLCLPIHPALTSAETRIVTAAMEEWFLRQDNNLTPA